MLFDIIQVITRIYPTMWDIRMMYTHECTLVATTNLLSPLNTGKHTRYLHNAASVGGVLAGERDIRKL